MSQNVSLSTISRVVDIPVQEIARQLGVSPKARIDRGDAQKFIVNAVNNKPKVPAGGDSMVRTSSGGGVLKRDTDKLEREYNELFARLTAPNYVGSFEYELNKLRRLAYDLGKRVEDNPVLRRRGWEEYFTQKLDAAIHFRPAGNGNYEMELKSAVQAAAQLGMTYDQIKERLSRRGLSMTDFLAVAREQKYKFE